MDCRTPGRAARPGQHRRRRTVRPLGRHSASGAELGAARRPGVGAAAAAATAQVAALPAGQPALPRARLGRRAARPQSIAEAAGTMAVKTIDLIVGARPNFVKVAPVYRALQRLGPAIALRLVHTGQHYDVNMSDSFFEQLNIPAPDVSLGVRSGEHGAQTAAIMAAYEASLLQA